MLGLEEALLEVAVITPRATKHIRLDELIHVRSVPNDEYNVVSVRCFIVLTTIFWSLQSNFTSLHSRAIGEALSIQPAISFEIESWRKRRCVLVKSLDDVVPG